MLEAGASFRSIAPRFFSEAITTPVSRHMGHLLVLIALSFLSSCSTCAGGTRRIEQLDKFAGGFCEVTLAISGDFGFESVGHFNHCFYKSRDFGQCGSMSVAPSDLIGIWQENSRTVVAFRPTFVEPVVFLLAFQLRTLLSLRRGMNLLATSQPRHGNTLRHREWSSQ